MGLSIIFFLFLAVGSLSATPFGINPSDYGYIAESQHGFKCCGWLLPNIVSDFRFFGKKHCCGSRAIGVSRAVAPPTNKQTAQVTGTAGKVDNTNNPVTGSTRKNSAVASKEQIST